MADVSDGISKFIKKSSKQIKKLRETVKRLKDDQKEKKVHHEPEKPRSKHKEEVIMHLSMASVAKATLVVLGLIVLANFLGQIADIILVFFIAILLAAALDPTVDWFEKRKVPRPVSVLGIFLVLIFVLIFFISQLIPLVASQLIELAKNLNTMVSDLSSGNSTFMFSETLQPIFDNFWTNVDQDLIVSQVKEVLETVGTQLQSVAGNTFGAIKAIFNGIFNFVLVLILTFFLVVTEKSVDDFFISLFPSKHGKYLVEKIETVKNKVGDWLRGQMILIVAMFSLTLIGLLILGVDYALTLAMMAGIAELLPVVGPITAGVPAVLVAFNESPWLAVWVIGLILLLQQIEGQILIPLIMKKAVGLSPIITILAVLIGFETLGILGIIIAIPVTATLSIFVRDYVSKQK
jgi:predicted PurR-regulated permease PerM